MFQSCNRCYRTERTLKSWDQKEISLSRTWHLQDQKCCCPKDVPRAKITTWITTRSIPIISSVLSLTKFTIMTLFRLSYPLDSFLAIIVLSLEIQSCIAMAQDEDGVISIKGGDAETMTMIANKRLQEIHSLFHYAYLFFFHPSSSSCYTRESW